MQHRLGVIGGGNMGRAIVEGAIRAGVLQPEEIIVAERDGARRKAIADLGCPVIDDPRNVLAAEQIMLAIKPQSLDELAEMIGPLERSMVVISIMAGKSSASIRRALGENARVVRVMPNTPCRIGEGMAGIALGEGARPGDETLAVRLFDAIGRSHTVDESMMHEVTAISGSGPAYVFLLAESMEQAAQQMGMSNAEAHLFVKQTILGAARQLAESGQTADQLRSAVTSPGGTTAAALELMFEQELPQIISEAVIAARDRGRELDAAAASRST